MLEARKLRAGKASIYAKVVLKARNLARDLVKNRKNTFIIDLDDFCKNTDKILKSIGINNPIIKKNKTNAPRPKDSNHEKLRNWQVSQSLDINLCITQGPLRNYASQAWENLHVFSL